MLCKKEVIKMKNVALLTEGVDRNVHDRRGAQAV